MNDARQIVVRTMELERENPNGGRVMQVGATWVGAGDSLVVDMDTLSAEERAMHTCLRVRKHTVYFEVVAARLYMMFKPLNARGGGRGGGGRGGGGR
jgi:hypothetical protein